MIMENNIKIDTSLNMASHLTENPSSKSITYELWSPFK